ncbi:T9SS type A sorting domain-containing protein [Wenyingzhuangia sp. IMCC45533]
MMKIFTTALILWISLSYQVNGQFTMSEVGSNAPILNEQTFTFNTTSINPAEVKFHINNTTQQPIKVWSQVVSIDGADGDQFQFCFSGECFFKVSAGQNVPSEPITVPAGQNQGNNFDHLWNQNTSRSRIAYRVKFFQVDRANRPIGVPLFVNYVYDQTLSARGIFKTDKLAITNHIDTATLSIDTKKAGVCTLYNIVGIQIKKTDLSEGQNNLSLDDFPSGTYLLHIALKSGRKIARKIIVI